MKRRVLVQEWGKGKRLNSFNSMKGLLYKQWFDKIIEGKFLPPIEVNIDPVNSCQLDCIWCNSKKVIKRGEMVVMPRDHLLKIIKFLADWGVKAVCFAGGGESVLHPNLDEAFIKCKKVGLESAVITNGLFLNDKQLKIIASCAKWVGISVDCAKRQTFKDLKEYDRFDEVIDNIRTIARVGTQELTYKFLIHPLNQYEIYDACKLAKQLGCNRFHARPIAFLNYQGREEKYDIKEILNQTEQCHKLNSKNFEVLTIFHKYDKDMHRSINFKKCKASPLLVIFEANGDVNTCLDRKGDPRTKLCTHYPNLNVVKQTWGSKRHKQLLNKINPKEDCPKCTFNLYNELFEAYKRDDFHWRFT